MSPKQDQHRLDAAKSDRVSYVRVQYKRAKRFNLYLLMSAIRETTGVQSARTAAVFVYSPSVDSTPEDHVHKHVYRSRTVFECLNHGGRRLYHTHREAHAQREPLDMALHREATQNAAVHEGTPPELCVAASP